MTSTPTSTRVPQPGALGRGSLPCDHPDRQIWRPDEARLLRVAYGEPEYGYLMTRRIERAMALLRRGGLSVTEVCFAVGCSSPGTFSAAMLVPAEP